MKYFLICVFSFFFFASSAQNSEGYFLSQPSLTPDGKTVIFSFEGDIWRAEVSGGQAYRLTAMQGYETTPRFLPMENGSHLPEDNMVIRYLYNASEWR